MQETITKIEDLLEDLEELKDDPNNTIINPIQLEDIIYELNDIKERMGNSIEDD